MRLKAAVFNLCVAIALLLAQQGGYWHALSHYSGDAPAQQEKGLPHSKTCPLDAVYAEVASGMATAAPLLSTAACGYDLIAFPPQFLPAALVQAPSARAPPLFL